MATTRKGQRSWTEQEDQFLKQNYTTRSRKWMAAAIDRSVAAIQHRSCELGLTRKYVGTLAKNGKKTCATCGDQKDINQFTIKRRQKDGLSGRCKECHSLSTTAQAYGISIKTLLELKKKHNDHCGLCGEPCKKLQVDHCHTTKNVRGLLCNRCNFALGQFGDSIDLLQKAIKYLSQPGIPPDPNIQRYFRVDLKRRYKNSKRKDVGCAVSSLQTPPLKDAA